MGETANRNELLSRRRPKQLVAYVFAVVVVLGLPSIARQMRATAQKMQVPENADYTRFQHASSYHARLPCALCHRSENNSVKPVLPGGSKHLPCAGCHVKQFADSSHPICTICHTNVQSGSLKPFPTLTSFSMRFEHARHVRMNNLSCSSCHRASRRGVAMTIPTGFNAHVTCNQCHASGAKSGDRDISSCGVCHQLGRPTRVSQTAPAFQVGFSHSKHDKSEGLSCNECHQVRMAAAVRLQISSPQPLNHHASAKAFSCISCHNGKRAFGGDDFSSCKRCHKGAEWHF